MLIRRRKGVEQAHIKMFLISYLPLRKKFFRAFGDVTRIDFALDVTPVFRPTQTDVVHAFHDIIDDLKVNQATSSSEINDFVDRLPSHSIVIVFRPQLAGAFLRNLVPSLREAGHKVVLLENKRTIRLSAGIAADVKCFLRPIWYRYFRSKFRAVYLRPEVDLLLTNDASACAEAFCAFKVKRVGRVKHMDAFLKGGEPPKRPQGGYGVLVDANLPFHPEHIRYAAGLDVRRYFDQLRRAMEAYMQQYGLRQLEFSRHPNSDGRELEYLDWQPISQFKTHELVASAERIISTGSDASGLAHQLGVPGHILVLPEVTSLSWVERQMSAAESFGAGVLEYRALHGLVEVHSPKGLRSRVRSATWRRFYAADAPDASQFLVSWASSVD